MRAVIPWKISYRAYSPQSIYVQYSAYGRVHGRYPTGVGPWKHNGPAYYARHDISIVRMDMYGDHFRT